MPTIIESSQLSAELRTYFFDLIKGDHATGYLKITESKKVSEGYERSTLLVDEKYLDGFILCLHEIRESSRRQKYAVRMAEQKALHSNAYKPWTREDDELLENLYCEGKTTKELSAYFARNKGAISSRIKKLELRKKYD